MQGSCFCAQQFHPVRQLQDPRPMLLNLLTDSQAYFLVIILNEMGWSKTQALLLVFIPLLNLEFT